MTLGIRESRIRVAASEVRLARQWRSEGATALEASCWLAAVVWLLAALQERPVMGSGAWPAGRP